METTYRLNTKEITMTFLESLKTLFFDQEVEISIKPINTISSQQQKRKEALHKMIEESRESAPKIDSSVDLRALIDQTYSKEI
jgi:hypothetical protein